MCLRCWHREYREMNQKKKLIELPPEVRDKFLSLTDVDERNTYIRKLKDAGWTFTSIGVSAGMTRERVRQIATDYPNAISVELDETFIIPVPPNHPEKSKREFVEPSPEVLARLLELQPMAQQVRSNAMRFRAEAEEYVKLLNHAHEVEGVPLYRLGKRLGVSHSAIRFRLARYGYKISENGQSKVYKPISDKNRVSIR